MMAQPDLSECHVAVSGRLVLPTGVRHRWGLDRGGLVDVSDVGSYVVVTPAGGAMRLFADLLSREEHAAFVRDLDDPDLSTT